MSESGDGDDLLVHSGLDHIEEGVVWRRPGGKRKRDDRAAWLEVDGRNTKEYIYGNYDKYYGYRTLAEDRRVKALAEVREGLEGKAWLDVGCNNGQLTGVLARELKAGSVLGVDIDSRLIERAGKMLPKVELPSSSYFPLSCAHQLGQLDPPSTPKISFETVNIVNPRHNIPLPPSGCFDAIFCLSCTKWIQLNFGDEGIRAAFLRMYDLLPTNGLLILEPQPWKSYLKTGSKIKDKVVLSNRYKLNLRPEAFDAHLKKLGFELVKKLLPKKEEESGGGFTQRELLLYRKK